MFAARNKYGMFWQKSVTPSCNRSEEASFRRPQTLAKAFCIYNRKPLKNVFRFTLFSFTI